MFMRKMVWIFIGVQLLMPALLWAKLDPGTPDYYKLHEDEYLCQKIDLRVCSAHLLPARGKQDIPNCQTVRVGVRSHGEPVGPIWVVVPDAAIEAFLNRYSEGHDSGKPLQGYLYKFPRSEQLFVYYSDTPLSEESKAWLGIRCSENEKSKPQRK